MKICALPHRTWFPRREVSPGVRVGRDALDLPSKWAQPVHAFVMPGVDLFAQPRDFVAQVFAVMNREQRHEFQVATRYVKTARAIAASVCWTANIWLGAQIDDAMVARDALEELRATQAQVRFALLQHPTSVAAMPSLHGLDFVVVEASEEPDGVDDLGAACDQLGVRLFVGKSSASAELRVPSLAVVGSRSISRTQGVR